MRPTKRDKIQADKDFFDSVIRLLQEMQNLPEFQTTEVIDAMDIVKEAAEKELEILEEIE